MKSRIFLSTALALTLALPAAAATPMHRPSVATGGKVAPGETVEQRIATLHDELRITPSEEPKWNDVANAMRQNAADMQRLAAEKHAGAPNLTAKQSLKTYQEFAQAHVDGLKKLRKAFDSLYNFMPDSQRLVADQVFQKNDH